jgi:dihydroorotase-like cyclic amidohydrolase
MDSLITAAARALAAGDPLGALNRVALRDDAPALALRGIAMAQLGDLVRAKALVRNAARAFGPKEAVARARCVVAEAEIALVDPRESWTIRARESVSTQDNTPFEGIELSARVKATFLRGALVCENGKVLGPPRGRYRHRPT